MNRNKNKRIQLFYVVIFAITLLTSPIFPSFQIAEYYSSGDTITEESSHHIFSPVIYHPDKIDRDFDGIADGLEKMILSIVVTNSVAILPVVVTLRNPVKNLDLDHFRMFGGQVTYVYKYVTYGFAGLIPAVNTSSFAEIEGDNLSVIEYDSPVKYHLDASVPLVRARPIVWDNYGYMGSPNYSIAIVDTGIDDSHPDLGPYGDQDFSKRIVGWYDATNDNSSTPEDYGEHGTHVAGIVAGTGESNNLQSSGNIQTTFTYVLPDAGYGYIDYIDVMNPGVIKLTCNWSGSNVVLLRLYNPVGSIVDEIIGATPPLTISYLTEGSSYPIGRYRVLVGNYIGPPNKPFSCLETYPYEGRNDGYNLFMGVAPNSKLVGVKVFDNTGSGTLSTLIKGMDWIVKNRRTYRIVVASMSLGLVEGVTDSTLDQKADTMVQNGIVTIVSAGNEYPDHTIGSPGTAAYVITVAATNDQNGITSYSSNGDMSKNEYGLIKPDVAAPGGTFRTAYGNRIVSADSNDVDGAYSGFADQNENDYQQMAGTSMSAPHVAGLAALLVQAFGSWNWTREEALKVKMILGMTAFETQTGEGTNQPLLDRGGKDNVEGYGRISADAAIEAVTLSYSLREQVNGTLGSGPATKKVWARQVSLSANTSYRFELFVPDSADYDLYLYSENPDDYGQPILMSKSSYATIGADEVIEYVPNVSGIYYLVAKRVSGNGNFTLQSSGIPLHDVAVLNVEPLTDKLYKGDTLKINATVKNEGLYTESFNVTVFYDNNPIETQRVSDLVVGSTADLLFVWNTSTIPYGNYTIGVKCEVVVGEYEISDNVLIDGTVHVKILGDVNGDNNVNSDDFYIFAGAYGSSVEQSSYNPEADLDRDRDIDSDDFFIFAGNYGKIA